MSDRSTEAERSAGARALTLLGLITAGAGSGAVMRWLIARDSEVALMVSCVVLPLALLSGLGLWFSAALGLGLGRLIGSFFAARWRTPWGRGKRFVPPGSALIIPTCLAFSVAGAVVIAAVSEQATLIPALALFACGGIIYGVVAWRLARLGYLSLAEEA